MHAARTHPAHPLNGYRASIPAASESRTAAHRLKVAEAVRYVQPADAVSEKLPDAVVQHHIQFGIVNQGATQIAIVLDGALRRRPRLFVVPLLGRSPHGPRIAMNVDARLEVAVSRMP